MKTPNLIDSLIRIKNQKGRIEPDCNIETLIKMGLVAGDWSRPYLTDKGDTYLEQKGSETMKNTKHTKAPWKAELHDGKYEVWSVTEFVASIPESIVTDKKANAHLIAAAPEMLEALERIMRYYNASDDLMLNNAVRESRDLIKKARGES